MLTEAEARAFVGKKLRLGSPCPRNTTSHSTFQKLQAKDAPPATCDRCGTTGYGKGRLDDWHGSELQLALRRLGWLSRVGCGQSHCWAEVLHISLNMRFGLVAFEGQGETPFEGQGDTPDEALSIAAALALQQEAVKGP